MERNNDQEQPRCVECGKPTGADDHYCAACRVQLAWRAAAAVLSSRQERLVIEACRVEMAQEALERRRMRPIRQPDRIIYYRHRLDGRLQWAVGKSLNRGVAGVLYWDCVLIDGGPVFQVPAHRVRLVAKRSR